VESAAQWAGLHGAPLPPFTTCEQAPINPLVSGPVWSTPGANGPSVELWLLRGFGHAAPVAPASGCGREGNYVSDAKVCAASEIASFFGL
jgi:poly(3-hydroxybutyrate) depolymerase